MLNELIDHKYGHKWALKKWQTSQDSNIRAQKEKHDELIASHICIDDEGDDETTDGGPILLISDHKCC